MKLDAREAAFRKAGWKDVPFIYELMLDGSLQGCFSDHFLTATGHAELLFLLLRGVKSSRPLQGLDGLGRSWLISTLIFEAEDQPLGFIRCGTWCAEGAQPQAMIVDCAVAAACRGAGIGGRMIGRYLQSLPDDTRVIAYCTKYARAMQATLKRLRFVRSRASGRLECYCTVTGASRSSAPVDSPARRRGHTRGSNHSAS